MNKYQEAYERLSSRTYQYADKESVYKDIETLGELTEIIDDVISIEILEGTDGSIQYGVHYPEYPNVVGGGITLEEAIEELKSNIKVYFEYLKENQ